MAGIAVLASQKGHKVIGYDKAFQPPMKKVLEDIDITLHRGYPKELVLNDADMVIVGNQLKRSDPIIQFLVAKRHKLYSGPEWLMTYVLRDRRVIAVTGTHGKTTITSMISWMLKQLGQDPGYLIGGYVEQLQGCANLGTGDVFVIEADEYDTAFFDKRPKFLHYWPSCVVISHIDFDHADVYPSLEAMVQQYKYLMRLLPADGAVVATGIPASLQDQMTAFGLKYVQYSVSKAKKQGMVLPKQLVGDFNLANILAAVETGCILGLDREKALSVLNHFHGVDRRQMVRYQGAVWAYDDFAHHPKAVAQVCRALSARGRVMLIYHPGTYTQRHGVMDESTYAALLQANKAYILLPPKHQIDLSVYASKHIVVCEQEAALSERVISDLQEGDQVVVTSAYYLSELWTILLAGIQKKFGDTVCISIEEGVA